MIKQIEEGKIRIKTTNPIDLVLNNSIATRIKDNWNSFIKNNDNYFDGEIYIVSSIK